MIIGVVLVCRVLPEIQHVLDVNDDWSVQYRSTDRQTDRPTEQHHLALGEGRKPGRQSHDGYEHGTPHDDAEGTAGTTKCISNGVDVDAGQSSAKKQRQQHERSALH